MMEHSQVNAVRFASGDGTTELEGLWHLPVQHATNSALIVLHGSSYTKEAELNRWICEGAAQLGITALRFDFRYVQTKQKITPELVTEMDDLIGAYNFLQSFGKEIKPKRLYLVGKSLGAIVTMKAVAGGPLQSKVQGVAALGLPLHDPAKKHWYDYSSLPKLNCPVLFVTGEFDNLGSSQELQSLLDGLQVAHELQIIKSSGHSYEPMDQRDIDSEILKEKQLLNQRKVANIVTDWLKQQDSIREDLRK